MSVETTTRPNCKVVSRISMSLPEDLLCDLDEMIAGRGFTSRSSAISDMIHQCVVDYKSQHGDHIMAGVITLVYDNTVSGLQKRLADLQFRYIDEVISSLHVHMMNNQTMEVILVQGPAAKLQTIADEMISKRGVTSGKIHLMASLIPQVHPFTGERPNAESARKSA
jgi:CopG family nickel-responsive transcriptional regulator